MKIIIILLVAMTTYLFFAEPRGEAWQYIYAVTGFSWAFLVIMALQPRNY